MKRNIDDIQAQLNGKMHWDASKNEIREWLSSKHSITGELADEMVRNGTKAKGASTRRKSILHFVTSLIAALFFGMLLWILSLTERTRIVWEIVLTGALVGCAGFAARSLYQIVTGKSDTAIDA